MRRVGIVGCGGIAQVHTWALRNMKDVDLSVFCDIDISKAKSLAGTSGEICDDWKALCTSDLDVIHICTPHNLHAAMATEYLKSGKAVFMEKPCAVSEEEYLILRQEDSLHPGMLGVCFQNRYNESTLLMDRYVKDGMIGRIRGARAMVTWRRDDMYYTESSWKGKLASEGGGALINQSIHTLDLLLRYLGEPVIIRGNTANHHLVNKEIEVEDTVEAWLEFDDGSRACFYASNGYVSDAPIYLELQGEKGRLCLNGTELTVYREGDEPIHTICDLKGGMGKSYWGCGHKACIEDFYRCLDTGDPYQNSLSNVENTFWTTMRIYEAARENNQREGAKING